MADRIVVEGKVERIFFQRANTNFYIGSLRNGSNKKIIRFIGNVPNCEIGLYFQLEGEMAVHPVYGEQLKVTQATQTTPPSNESEIIKFFSSSLFAGVGKTTAQKIYNALGEDAIDLVIANPDILVDTCNLSAEMASKVANPLLNNPKSIQISRLLKAGISQKDITRLQNLPDQVLKKLKDDPFYPYYYLSGFGYESAKRIANVFHLAKDDPMRLKAEVYDQIQRITYQFGCTTIPIGVLCQNAQMNIEQVMPAIEQLEAMGLVIQSGQYVYLIEQYNAEQVVAHALYQHTFEVDQPDLDVLYETIAQVEQKNNITYDDTQKKAIEQFFSHSMMILNGGPGTGKSTLLKGILDTLKILEPSSTVVLCAPTGRAAKRMKELTNRKAQTIHSLLKWDFETNMFGVNESDPLKADYVIVDEFSMVDSRLFASLLRGIEEHCQILLIGDEEQLESVGPGNVLNDLIASNKVPVVHLKKLYRQKEGSGISILADQIRNFKEIEFIDPVTMLERNESATLSLIENLVLQQEHPEDVQILAPKYDGDSGIYAINAMMQTIVNPFHPLKEQLTTHIVTENGRKEVYFRKDDKILLKKNHPEINAFNGDIGTISQVDPVTNTLWCQFSDTTLEVEKTNLLETISHAWCISIHKAQGSEYQDVCVVADHNGAGMLKKRLLYTAISRAKKNLTIVGSEQLFRQGVKRIDTNRRITTLQQRLDQVWQSATRQDLATLIRQLPVRSHGMFENPMLFSDPLADVEIFDTSEVLNFE